MNIKDITNCLKVAIIVGTILNLINQWDVLINLAFDKVNYYKFVLTYLVPFGVSVYSTIVAKPGNEKE